MHILMLIALFSIIAVLPFCDWYDRRRTRREDRDKEFGHFDGDAMWPH